MAKKSKQERARRYAESASSAVKRAAVESGKLAKALAKLDERRKELISGLTLVEVEVKALAPAVEALIASSTRIAETVRVTGEKLSVETQEEVEEGPLEPLEVEKAADDLEAEVSNLEVPEGTETNPAETSPENVQAGPVLGTDTLEKSVDAPVNPTEGSPENSQVAL